MVSMIKTRTIPFVTYFDIFKFVSPFISLIFFTRNVRIPHYHPKCSRDSKRPTPCNGAELVSSSEIDHFLTECHVLPSSLRSAVNKRYLIRICPFPVHAV
jgi:hypothetical protein